MTSKIVATLAAVALGGNALATDVLTYSGYLRDAQDRPVTATTTVTFRFYPVATGGAAEWEDAVTVLPNADGWFSAVLGASAGNPLDRADFAEPLWLGVQVASDANELAPRMRIGMSPYALTVDWAGVTGRPSAFPTSWDLVAAKPTYFAADPAVVQSRISGSCPPGAFIVGVGPTGSVSCAPDANTTYSAGSGLTLSRTTFAADATKMQSRVMGNCAANSSIRAIASDGSVTCEADDAPTYTAGPGLSLSGNTFSILPDSVGPREVQLIADSSSASAVLGAGGGIVHTMGSGVTFTDATRCFVTVTSRLQPPAGVSYFVLRAEEEFVDAPVGGVAGSFVPFSPPQNGWSSATISWVFTVWPTYPIRFGCWVEGGTGLAGVTAYCAVSYLCF